MTQSIEQTMTEGNQGPVIAGVKVTGPKNKAVDAPCEDAWATKQLGPRTHAIAVADGVGSAKESHIGSQLATTTAVTALEEKLASVDQIEPVETEPAIKEAIRNARTALQATAERAGEDPFEYDTTLLVAVVTQTGVAGAVVGDGGIVSDTGDNYELLVPREDSVVDLPASNYTIPLTHDDWEISYRFGSLDDYAGVAVFTDGLENFTWAGDPVSDHFFDVIFTSVRKSTSADEATQELRDVLTSEKITEFSDDKTIAIAERSKPKRWNKSDKECQKAAEIQDQDETTPDTEQDQDETSSHGPPSSEDNERTEEADGRGSNTENERESEDRGDARENIEAADETDNK